MIEKLDFSKSKQYTLSIRLSTDGFSFSVLNPLEENGYAIYEYSLNEGSSLTANLKQVFKEKEWLNFPYRRINILIANNRFTFIPLEYFEDEQAETIFYHNFSTQENEIIRYNILHRNDTVVVFGMDKSVYTFLCDQYPEAHFYSQASIFIEYFSSKSRLGNNQKMYVNLRENATDVYAFERNRLLLANSFSCKAASDRLYYVLYIWKQLRFDQERDELHLTGLLASKEPLLRELRKYIRQVFITNPATNLDLQAITQCE